MTRVHKIRSRQRGAAMAEMVLLAPVMILMWFGIDYFRSGYARRLEAINESHAKAWALAYSNDGSCFANKEPWAGFTGENDTANTGEKGSEAAAAFKGGTTSSMFMYAHANVQTSWTTRTAHWDGSKGSMKAGTYVACNEVVPGTQGNDATPGAQKFDDQNVLTPLYEWVKSLF